MHRNRGFSLVEIIVATIILSLTILGLLGVFVAGNNWVVHFRERSTSAELGKLFVDPLQMDVREDTWTSGVAGNALTAGDTYCDNDAGHTQNKNCPTQEQRTVNAKEFTTGYRITADSPAAKLRKVTTIIRWSEAATR